MSESRENPDSGPVEDRPNLDGRLFGKPGEPDVHIARDFWRKVAFLLFSTVLLVIGIWETWGPASRVIFGKTHEARVVRLIRKSPGEAEQAIRIRRQIEEGDYAYETRFRHFVEVFDEEGNPAILEMAVASRQTPYALVNDTFTVVHFADGDYAYGLWHHRTWAIGLTFLLMGLTFVPLSAYLLYLVGRPVVIDPEDPKELEKERRAREREVEHEQEHKRELIPGDVDKDDEGAREADRVEEGEASREEEPER